MAFDSVEANDKKIFDLTEVYEEKNGRSNQEVIVVDSRGYERIDKNNKYIHELVDIDEDHPAGASLNNEEMIKLTVEIVEKIAREMIPEITERVIREEIEKLKRISGESKTVN